MTYELPSLLRVTGCELPSWQHISQDMSCPSCCMLGEALSTKWGEMNAGTGGVNLLTGASYVLKATHSLNAH